MLKNSPKDLQVEIETLSGFFRGVVEDNKDPLKAGRVRVRIHGIHTSKIVKDELEGIPTNELPWAEPCMPIHEGSVSGFGVWSVPLQGSQVMLFFENSNVTQPRYFASMPGIPESKEQYYNNNRASGKTDGFKDPDGAYPTKWRLGEPDVHRLARGISEGTLVDTKNQERDIGVPTALGGNWNEPQSPYNTVYPHNHVIATHGGITIELDSTPGSTRLHLYHPSNSFIEIDNDGNMVVKNNGEQYEIVTQGKNIHIKQQRNLTIDAGSKKRIQDNEEIEIGKSKTEEITENMDQKIGGNKSETISGNKTETISGNKTEAISGSKTENAASKTETISGNKTEILGGLNITVSGSTSITSPTINLIGTVNIAGLFSVAGGGGGTVAGTLTISGGDVIADGISLKNHTHSDPQGGNTGPAQ
jgi:phage baseplate assembly protein gpV